MADNGCMPSRRRPSKHAREHVPLDVTRIQGGATREEAYAGGRWTVRAVTGASATRPYLCPGCQQDIPPGLPHAIAAAVGPVEMIELLDRDGRRAHHPTARAAGSPPMRP